MSPNDWVDESPVERRYRVEGEQSMVLLLRPGHPDLPTFSHKPDRTTPTSRTRSPAGATAEEPSVVSLGIDGLNTSYLTFHLAGRDADPFIEMIESVIPGKLSVDTTHGLVYSSWIVADERVLPRELQPFVDDLGTRQIHHENDEMIIVFPSPETREIAARVLDILLQWGLSNRFGNTG